VAAAFPVLVSLAVAVHKGQHAWSAHSQASFSPPLLLGIDHHLLADPESFHWVGIQYRNSAPQYATVLTTVLRYLGRRESGVVLGLPETWLGPPLSSPISYPFWSFFHSRITSSFVVSPRALYLSRIYLPFRY
jgi:hypothetical protein